MPGGASAQQRRESYRYQKPVSYGHTDEFLRVLEVASSSLETLKGRK